MINVSEADSHLLIHLLSRQIKRQNGLKTGEIVRNKQDQNNGTFQEVPVTVYIYIRVRGSYTVMQRKRNQQSQSPKHIFLQRLSNCYCGIWITQSALQSPRGAGQREALCAVGRRCRAEVSISDALGRVASHAFTTAFFSCKEIECNLSF